MPSPRNACAQAIWDVCACHLELRNCGERRVGGNGGICSTRVQNCVLLGKSTVLSGLSGPGTWEPSLGVLG